MWKRELCLVLLLDCGCASRLLLLYVQVCLAILIVTLLQIRIGKRDNSGIISHNTPLKRGGGGGSGGAMVQD